MKTDIIRIDSTGNGMEQALNEVEKFAGYEGLDHKQALQLRLLGEELMGMFRGITGTSEANFYAEGQNGECSLHLEASVNVNRSKKDELLSLSKSGKNIAARGFMGKALELFEDFMLNYDDVQSYSAKNEGGYVPFMTLGMTGADTMDVASGMPFWSLEAYRSGVEQQKGSGDVDEEVWDELEKSIVANLADDVQIGVRDRHVQMVILKKF